MKILKGNLLDMAETGQFDLIIHGANCFCTMKSGIAGEIARRYPEAVLADKQTLSGDKSKLGTFTMVRTVLSNFIIVNMYTQYNYGRTDSRYVDYEAVRNGLRLLTTKLKTYNMEGLRIGYPKVGAGLANGDWNVISEIFDTELAGFDHTLVVLED